MMKAKENRLLFHCYRKFFSIALFATLLAILDLSQQHGFVKKPPSRAYLCQRRINLNCGSVEYEPQSIEAKKGFPQLGPPDKHIAGGGIFPGLDATGRNRWKRIALNRYLLPLNKTHLLLPIRWFYTAAHSTSGFHLFGTVKGYDGLKPLKRSNLRFLHYVASPKNIAYENYNHTIPKNKLNAVGTLLSIWDVADTMNAYYQVIDYRYYNNKKYHKG